MFLNFVPLFVLASTVFASPFGQHDGSKQLQRRDGKTIVAVMVKIGGQLDKMKSQVTGWDGDAEKAVDILSASTAVMETLKAGIQTIQTTDAMGLTDALNMIPATNTLNTAVDGLITALISSKPKFDAAFLSTVVFDQLELQKVASAKMVDVIVAKLPAYVPGAIGTAMSAGILASLDKGVAAFKDPSAPAKPPPTLDLTPAPAAESASAPAPAPAPAPAFSAPAPAPKAKGSPKGSPKGGKRPPGVDLEWLVRF